MDTNESIKAAEGRMVRDMYAENVQLKAIVAEYIRRDTERDKRYFADIEVRRGREVVFR